MSSIPGWYPDPAGSPDLRLWDGQTWTSHTKPAAPPPAASPVATATEEPAGDASYYGSFIPGARDYSLPTPPPGSMPTPAPGSMYPIAASPYANPWQPQSRRLGGMSILVKVLIGVGAFFALAIVAAIVIPLFVTRHAEAIYKRTTVVMPPSAAGLTKITDSRGADFSASFANVPFPGTHLAGLYSDPAGGPGAVLIIAKTLTSSSSYDDQLRALEHGLQEPNSDGVTVSAFTKTDPGPLGGAMQCAAFTVKTLSGRACGFVDAGSVGLVMSFDPDNQNLILQLRSAMEKRS